MPPKQVEPKRWRVRAKATDGLIVTLGRYVTEREAKTDHDRFVSDGVYRDVIIDPIEVKEPPEDEAAQAAARKPEPPAATKKTQKTTKKK